MFPHATLALIKSILTRPDGTRELLPTSWPKWKIFLADKITTLPEIRHILAVRGYQEL